MLWFHIPYRIMVYGTSNGPQNDIGNHLGPCSRVFDIDMGFGFCGNGLGELCCRLASGWAIRIQYQHKSQHFIF